MGHSFDVHVFRLHGRFVAQPNGFMFLPLEDLRGARKVITAALEKYCGEGGTTLRKIRISLSEELKPHHPLCNSCDGSGEVEADYPAAAFLTGVAGTIDLSRMATVACGDCDGMGVRPAGFWD